MKAYFSAFAFFFLAVSSVSMAEVAPPQQSSATQCHAYTDCLDRFGRVIGRISCQVYGYQYLQARGVAANNSCSWFVQPYVAVECRGYQQMFNPVTGQYYWAWQSYANRCPGR